jgi:hypothetical protein
MAARCHRATPDERDRPSGGSRGVTFPNAGPFTELCEEAR